MQKNPPLSTVYEDKRGLEHSGIELFAEHGQRTRTAVRVSGGAAIPSEEHDPMAKIGAFLRREDLAKLLLYLFRLFADRKTKPAADADAMGVTDHTAGNGI